MKKHLTYFIKTFGCLMNEADSQRIKSVFQSRGFIPAVSMKNADYIIINSCMVRKSAEDRIYGLVRNLAKVKKINPKIKIIITGCLAGMVIGDKSGQLFKKIKERMPEVDEFLSIREIGFEIRPNRSEKNHALIPISNGCNNFCTYCVVPYTRGHEISRPYKEIIKECNNAIKEGYTEITLIGQNVNSYGSDLIKNKKRGYMLPNGKRVKPVFVKYLGRQRIPTLFPYLLEDISKLKNMKRVDFISSNPWDFSDELIEAIARNENISREIHIPVQSGDNEILKKMNRWYTAAEYLRLVRKLRSKIKNLSRAKSRDLQLSTDIIVGFPGETEEQFENTVKLCKKAKFTKAYIAMYSDRPMTVAHRLFTDNVSRQEKRRRWQILDKLINKNHYESKITSKSSQLETKCQKILIICGPTATGKTATAIKLARTFDGEIISADSRQVYKGMDIVTGKDINNLQFTICNLRKFGNEDITVGYYKKYGITIWGLDIVNPDKDFSVAHFVEYTEIAIEDITKRGKLPIIVGGTGLYIKAITDGIETVNIPRNEKLRKDLATKTIPELQEILQDVNSQKYASMNGSDRKNPRRLIRAIEVARFERKPVHYERTEFHSKNLVNVLVIGLSATNERLHKRIDDRVAKRIKHGAVEETKRLLNSGYNENLQSMSGIGYGELVRYVKGTISSQEAIEKWRREEYKYCRRQLTWFKKDKRIKWIDITEKNWHQELEKIICRWYNLH